MHNFHTISGLRDQISREILVGIVVFLPFKTLPLKLHVIQTPLFLFFR